MKKLLRLLCLLCAAFIATFAVACGSAGTTDNNGNSTNGSATGGGSSSDVSTDYTTAEQAIVDAVDYDFSVLSSDVTIPIDAVEVASSDTAVNLIGGSYVLSGEYTKGIVITAETDVHIYLNGATISNSKKAIEIVKGETTEDVSVTVTVVDGTTNTISNTSKNAFDSAISVNINGSGMLNVLTTGNNAIKVDGALKIVDVTLNVDNQGEKNAISAYSVWAQDCTINVSAAGKDGIHAEMDDGVTAWTVNDGYVILNNVTYTADVSGDGIQADTFVYINGGSYDITTTAEFVSYSAENIATYELETDDFKYAKSGTVYTKKASKTITSSNVTSLYAMKQSSKGIKVGEIDYEVDSVEYTVTTGNYYIIIDGGTFNINSDDDAIHAKFGNVTINGGIFTISTLDDGITADLTTKINGGAITVNKCFEGIEGGFVVINGGTINLTCSDDGINASSDDNSTNIYIKINGGAIAINAQGDGIDSNGTATIAGGTVYVFGPTAGGNSALDSEGSVLISGGTVVAISKEAMDRITCNKPYVSATNVTLSNGNTVSIDGVVSVTVPKAYSGATVIICSENLTSGTSYTLRLGSTSKTVTASTGSQGGMGGGMNGGGQGFPSGGMGGKQRP